MYKTLTKYRNGLTKVVERKIAKLLPDKFALIFDGWTKNLTHYVSLCIIFPSKDGIGYRKVLLAFLPFQNEDSQGTDTHY